MEDIFFYDKFYSTNENDVKESSEPIATKDNDVSINDYDLFVNNLKKDRVSKEEGVTYSYVERFNSSTIGEFAATLTSDGVLSVSYFGENYKKYDTELDTGVLFFQSLPVGNGGFSSIYYVKEYGKVYSASVEYNPYEGKMPVASSVRRGSNCEKIVKIMPTSIDDGVVGASGVSFVDINGNICNEK